MVKKLLNKKWVLLVNAGLILTTLVAVAGQSEFFQKTTEKKTATSDPWQLIGEIFKNYETDSVLMQSGNIILYDEKKPKEILEQFDCTFYIQDTKMYSRIGPRETYCDEEMIINTDQENRIISVMPADKETKDNMPGIRQLKSMLKKINGTLEVIVEDNREVLLFYSEFATELNNYRIYFDPVTYQVNKIKMDLWKEDAFLDEAATPFTMEIRYYKTEKAGSFPENLGQVRFLVKEIDSVRLQPAYAGYELYNQFF